MKIYILDHTFGMFQLVLDSARNLDADVLVVEKSGGITAAYPLSDNGKANLGSLKLKSHRQPEYDISFYPLPFGLHGALTYLNNKFRLDWANPPHDARPTDEYRSGDLVICPTETGNQILVVDRVRPIAPGAQKTALHTQFVVAKTTFVSITQKSGYHVGMVLQE